MRKVLAVVLVLSGLSFATSFTSNGTGGGNLSAGAAGTQSGTVTIVNGDYFKATFIADGTSKQTTWHVSETY